VTDVLVSGNTVNNAGDSIRLVDVANITLSNNTLLFPRKNSIAIVQNTPAAVYGNTMDGNTLLQRNVDYPYIEMRDETPGTGTASLIAASGNNFVTLYKPDTSYVRSVKFGGETVEYNKKSDLDLFDATNTRFQSFGYAPYTSTGNYATANLLTNPDFEADVSGWTPYADVGATPSLSQVVGGTYSGNSLLMTPQDVTPDHFGITNDAIMSITTGQVYEVSGYLRSNSTGELNIKAYLHQGGSRSTIYGDRIVETYSTATGRTFRFYITTTSDAADAQLSLESTNQDIALEIDEVSFRRKTIVMKNTEANEVLVFSNTGSSPINQ
jgi:parallel beta-helix repeat protein